MVFPCKWAAAAAFNEKITGNTSLGNVFALTQRKCKRVFPNLSPRGSQKISQSLVIRLAGDDLTIRFNAHVVIGSGATFDSQIELKGCDAVFMTGTSPMVLQFSSIGDINYKVPDPFIDRLRMLYAAKAEESLRSFAGGV